MDNFLVSVKGSGTGGHGWLRELRERVFFSACVEGFLEEGMLGCEPYSP